VKPFFYALLKKNISLSQHNPQIHEGNEGLVALFKRLSETFPKVNIVRIFEDDRAVEHWDNIQKRLGPNSSGHSW
jgi:predicted SnoaL-like aldol condensation-catalyzing enzyme